MNNLAKAITKEKCLEICEICKCDNKRAWLAPDHIWQTISGHDDEGILCTECFDDLARSKGVVLGWFVGNEPKEDVNNIMRTS